jgi:deoxyuridine 5'-triphosphate nucleotidohydrolase
MEYVQFKKLSPDAIIPTRSEPDAAGLDLYASEALEVPPLSTRLVKTNIAWFVPKGYYGRIAGRSGLAYKKSVDVFGGVIDSSYSGDIGVILFNGLNSETIRLEKGDRIAQLIIEKYYPLAIIEVTDLPKSIRGELGFGSSGV